MNCDAVTTGRVELVRQCRCQLTSVLVVLAAQRFENGNV